MVITYCIHCVPLFRVCSLKAEKGGVTPVAAALAIVGSLGGRRRTADLGADPAAGRACRWPWQAAGGADGGRQPGRFVHAGRRFQPPGLAPPGRAGGLALGLAAPRAEPRRALVVRRIGLHLPGAGSDGGLGRPSGRLGRRLSRRRRGRQHRAGAAALSIGREGRRPL